MKEMSFVKAAAQTGTGILLAKKVKLSDIEEHPTLKELFPIDDAVCTRIAETMKAQGFHQTHPVILWRDGEHLYLIDGYTRRRAAQKAGLEYVYGSEKSFKSFTEVYEYALGEQVNRRNLSDADLLTHVSLYMNLVAGMPLDEAKDKTKHLGKQLAEMTGASERTVAKAITVEKYADDELKADIKTKKKSLNAAYESVKKTRQSKPVSVSAPEDSEETDQQNNNVIDESIDENRPDSVNEQSSFFYEGFCAGVSEGAYQVYEKILSLLREGVTVTELESYDAFADFSFVKIAPALDIPISSQEILTQFNKL